MKRRLHSFSMIALLALMSAGCAHVISEGIRSQVDETITFRQASRSPETYTGKVVVWGGAIIKTTHQKEGTLLEILQKPLDAEGRPEDGDRSEGRFLALHKGFIDDAVFAKGRRITVAGEVMGSRKMPLGEIEYTYPLIVTKEVHLFPERSRERYAPYWYYPWWYDPWWDPWYGPRWHRHRW